MTPVSQARTLEVWAPKGFAMVTWPGPCGEQSWAPPRDWGGSQPPR